MTKLNGSIEITTRSPKPLRVVSIIGRGFSADTDCILGEAWGINHSWIYGHKLTKLFMLDGLKEMGPAAVLEGIDPQAFSEYCVSHPEMEMICPGADEIVRDGKVVRTCVPFPINVTSKLMPGQYFTSTIAHMLAYVAAQERLGQAKIDVVQFVGIELWGSVDADEYGNQAPCVDYWIAYLNGQGTQVFIPTTTMYVGKSKNRMYGYFPQQ